MYGRVLLHTGKLMFDYDVLYLRVYFLFIFIQDMVQRFLLVFVRILCIGIFR